MTAEEIRSRIIEVATRNGGHLASSLGAVEIAIALTETFDPFKDRIVWDVGHQAYAWKILTGRNDTFDTLRKASGVSPFPSPCESKADAAVAGHAGVSISVASGMAAARDAHGKNHVVAVIGDGAIGNGTAFEAINNLSEVTKKLIVVLNDNEMSISHPVGSFARFFGRLISSARYNRVKSAAESAGHKLRLTFLRETYHKIESRIKGLFVASRFFENFGMRYIGPVDGHNLGALKEALQVARDDKRSVIVHVVTKKGRGYAPAEQNPTAYHGVSPASPNASGEKPRDWSAAFGQTLSAMAKENDRIFALTAGMRDGTGLSHFAREFPARFCDVGIAEGHMLAFAAGLAAGGMRPVVAIYSTFLQRAIDQVMHDICLPSLPVVICVDRAGIVGADGATHQGLYDIAMLRCLPNLTICQPKDEQDFAALLEEALRRNSPTVIRYPRGAVKQSVQPYVPQEEVTKCIWATGDWIEKANAAARKVPGCQVVHIRTIKPFDEKLLASMRAQSIKIISLENACVSGGIGEAIAADLKLGWPDEFIPHGEPGELEKLYGLDVDSIAEKISRLDETARPTKG